jgi:hypothetical protein
MRGRHGSGDLLGFFGLYGLRATGHSVSWEAHLSSILTTLPLGGVGWGLKAAVLGRESGR